MKKVTMQDIADMAGVSRATVDKVIHNRSGVSDAVREKIRKIILETNYQSAQVRKIMKEERTTYRIAVVMSAIQDPFFADIKRGMDAAAAFYGTDRLRIDYYFYATLDAGQILAILESLEDKPIDGIAIRGLPIRGVIDRIAAFSQRGIPVFTFDEDLPKSGRIGYIGENTVQTGALAASLISRSIPRDGKIAILTGSRHVASSNNRIRGFSSYLKKYAPQMNIVTIEETLSQRIYTYQKTEALLKKYPDIDVIWNCVCHAEEMGQAVTDAGRQDDVRLIAFHFNSPSYIIDLVKNRTIDYAIILNPVNMGKQTITSLYEYLVTGIAPTKEDISVPVYIGCDVNIDLLT